MRDRATQVDGGPDVRPFHFHIYTLIAVVACCAPLFWAARELWDRRPENEPARAMRLLRSDDPAERQQGADSLQPLLMLNRLNGQQLDAAIPALVVALHDPEASVREKAMMSLFHVVFDAGHRTKTLPPRVDAIVPGLLEAMRDPTHAVRRNAALALANIYFTYSGDWKAAPPLPRDPDRFLEVLCQVIEDPDPETPTWAFQVLRETAPRMVRPAPEKLVKALESNNPATRQKAAGAIGRFPRGIDQVLPAFFRAIEGEDRPEYRRAYTMALFDTHPTPVAIPLLAEALGSRTKDARFIAAHLLSRIGPRAVASVPALLRLLDEPFEPSTAFERNRPEFTDPAVAASWALGAIAPGTDMAPITEAALKKVIDHAEYPWRHADAREALERIRLSAHMNPTGEPH